MLKLFRYLKKHSVVLIISFILLILQAIVNLSLPDYMSKIIDMGIVNKDMEYIVNIGMIMLLITAVGITASIVSNYIGAKIGSKVAQSIRKDVFEKVQTFSKEEFNKLGVSSLITRTTNDVQRIQMFITMFLKIIVLAPLTAGLAIIKIMNSSYQLVWIIILSVTILLTLVTLLVIIVMPKFNVIQGLVDKLNLITRESLNGIRVVRAFNSQKYQEKKFSVANDDINKTNLFINRVMSLLEPCMTFIMSLTALGILWFGSKLISQGTLQVGSMMAYVQYSTQIIMSFLMLTMVFVFLPRANVSAKRINEVLDMDPSIKDPKKEIKTKNLGSIEFNNVCFEYPDANAPILNNVNFNIYSKEKVAIIGGTGSGKSTIISLILRFFDVTDGSILIDDIDIRNINQKTLRNKIGYISQKPVIFSGTIESNVTYGMKKVDKKKVKKALEISQAWEFVKEKGIDEKVSQAGTNLSGGQKQRLAIARAIAKDSNIIIFDDSFSSLDFNTEKKLRKAINKEVKDKTIITIAQRVSSITDSDKIIVLDNGNMVGIGTHKELLLSCSVYKEIALSQLSKEEL